MSRPKIGEIFQSRYLIISELGSGGMGLVYLAKQIDADREVALKLIRDEKSGDGESLERFYREFKVLSRLSHPNIVTIYGLARDEDDLPYAICEYVEGRSLRNLLNEEKTLEWERAAKITIQICNAMKYAHAEGVIHRDLKPDNVMLLSRPEPDFVKLVDFGLSRVLFSSEEFQKFTVTGQLIGTVNYMAPEVLKVRADERSDIYSLACLIFEMLAGEYLFDADAAVGVIFKHCNEDPAGRFKAIPSKIPLRFVQLLAKMLAKRPENRYSSMQEIADELQSILEDPGQLIKASRAALKKTPALSKIIIGIAAGTICVLIIVAAGIKFQQRRSASVSTAQPLAHKQTKNMLPRRGDSMGVLIGNAPDIDTSRQLAKQWRLANWNRTGITITDKVHVLSSLSGAEQRNGSPAETALSEKEILTLLPLLPSDIPEAIVFKCEVLGNSAAFWLQNQQLKRAEELVNEIVKIDRSGTYRVKPTYLQECVYVLMSCGKYKEALEVEQSCQRRLLAESAESGRQQNELDCGDLQVFLGNTASAKTSYEDACKLVSHILAGKTSDALEIQGKEYLAKAVKRLKSADEQDRQGLQLCRLGERLYYFDKAEGQKVFTRGVDLLYAGQSAVQTYNRPVTTRIAQAKYESVRPHQTWLLLANAADEMGLAESALRCARMSLDTCRKRHQNDGQINYQCAARLSVALMKGGQDEESHRTFEKAQEYLNSMVDQLWAQRQAHRLACELAEAAAEAGHNDLASSYAQLTIRLAQAKTAAGQLRDACTCTYVDLARASELLGDKAAAALYWKSALSALPDYGKANIDTAVTESYRDVVDLVAAQLHYGMGKEAEDIIASSNVKNDPANLARCYCLAEQAKHKMKNSKYSEALPLFDESYRLLMQAGRRPSDQRDSINLDLKLKLCSIKCRLAGSAQQD